MRIVRDFALLSIALLLAYGGGYYFGRHPESLRDLVSSKSIVIATTEERVFTREVQNWLEDRWGHSIIVLLISENEIESRLNDTDLILARRSVLKPYESQLRGMPSDLPLDWIEPDFVLEADQMLPLLWRMVKIDDKRHRLVKLSLAWTPKSEDNNDLVRWLLSRSGQLLMTTNTGLSSVRRDILNQTATSNPLRSIPLQNLSWE